MACADDVFCQFVQGKLPVAEFEQWCYRTADLETAVGKGFYLDLIATRFDDPALVVVLKSALHGRLQARGYQVCECFRWADVEKLPLGFEWTSMAVEARFVLLRERTPWLALRRCCLCAQPWYVACDTVDDDWYFRRMSEREVADVVESGKWPPVFDRDERYGLQG